VNIVPKKPVFQSTPYLVSSSPFPLTFILPMMLRQLSLSALLWALLGLMACSGTKKGQVQAQNTQADEFLLGTWMHSHEEDGKQAAKVYRNVKFFTFPPARGRTGFTFSAESRCVYIGIAPADGPDEQPGKWGWAGKNQLRITLENGSSFNFKIEELTKDKMLLREE
jgi:P pilus assembly chaperone PapD